jgi:hypothetical protein
MGRIFKPGVNLREIFKDPEKRKLTGEAITSYLREGFYDKDNLPIPDGGRKLTAEMIIKLSPDDLKKVLAGEYIAAGDITGGAGVGVQRKEIFMPEVPADTQYLEIFRTVQSDKAGETYEQVALSIIFTQLKIGEKPKLGTITAAAPYVPNLKWGTAFGFFREWIEDNEVLKIEDVIQEAKIAAYDAKATFIYGMLSAAGFPEVTWGGEDTWITMLNKAIAALRRKIKNAVGQEVIALQPNQRPLIVCCVEKTAEVVQAIKDSLVTGQRGERLTMVPDVIDTSYLGATEPVYVLVPKRRFILQEREALRTETDKDIMLDAEAYAWYFRMNAIIIDKYYGRFIDWTE